MQSDLILQGDVSRAQLAEKILSDAAPLAAYSLVDLATNSEDENIRMRSSIYVLDRELGKPKTTTTLNLTQENPVLQLIEGVIVPRGTGAQGQDNPGGTDEYQEDSDQPATVIDQEPTPRTSPFAPPFTDQENPDA